MAESEAQTRADTQFDHLENRVNKLDGRLEQFGTQLGGLSRAVEGIGARLEVWVEDLRRATAERPSQWPTVIGGAGVFITVWMLSLAPVIWLAVANYDNGRANEKEAAIQAAQMARIEAQAEILMEDRRILLQQRVEGE